MLNIECLDRICNPLSTSWNAKPWRIKLDGVMWSGATDGRRLLAVRVDSDYPELPEKAKAKVEEYMRCYPVGTQVGTVYLRNWVGSPVCNICSDCSGTGSRDGGCPDCEHVCSYVCNQCDGNGTVEQWDDITTCELFGYVINKKLLRELLIDAPESVLVGPWAPEVNCMTPVYFIDDGWRALLMPMRYDAGDELGEPFVWSH